MVFSARGRRWWSDSAWVGDLPFKGLGVFSFGGPRITRLAAVRDDMKYYLPVEITGSPTLRLLGVWAMEGQSPPRAVPNPSSLAAAARHYAELLKRGPAVMAGDFNADRKWDGRRKQPFAGVEAELEQLGLRSCHDGRCDSRGGGDADPTLFWRRNRSRPFHVDYIYCSREPDVRVVDVQVGKPEEWLGLSDHMPVVTDLEIGC